MIQSILLKTLDSIPLPLIVGLIIVLSWGWLVSQLKSLPSSGHSIRERSFWIVLGVVLIAEVSWFAYKIVDERSLGVRFTDKEFGVYVVQFDNDKDGTATRLFAAILESSLRSEAPNTRTVSVRSSTKKFPDEDAASIFEATKAAVIIEGVLDQSDKLLPKFIKQGESDWQAIRNFIDLRRPAEFVDVIKSSLPSYRNTQDLWLQNELAGLRKQMEAQSQAILDVQSQLSALKNKNVTANLAPQTLVRSGVRGKGLIVGINAYQNNARLAFARSDAEAMEFALKSSGLETISLLDEAATKAKISDVFAETLRNRLREEDVFVFYFAGHGVSVPTHSGQKAGYICPVESNSEKVVATCISMGEIGEWLSLLKSRTVVLILDTCVSGLIAQKLVGPLGGSRGLITKKSIPPPAIFPALDGKTVVVLTAGEPDQLSTELPALQHGVFTFYFLQGMQGGADIKANGKISLKDLYEYTWTRVENATAGKQTPTLNIWGDPDVYLVGQQVDADLQLPPR
ncbi:caspase family protein [Bradyrhizobium betae]|nr:caspase family protein [Bradyrhizobium betae]